MPPRKKPKGTLKRSSSDGPSLDDMGSDPKRARPDAPIASTSHITLDVPAHKARKPVTYKSKARQKAGLSVATPPKLTSFGFNVEHKPKVGRALFHLSPSPRAKAKAKTKLFGSPKLSRRRGSKGGVSAESSRIEVEEYEEEDQPEERVLPGPSNILSARTPPRPSSTTLDEHDEAHDQAAPLPSLPAIRPIEGPGLEIRTPLKGRIIPPPLQSLSKRVPRTDATPIPLFAATPRPLPPQLPDQPLDSSPSKPHAIPVFAPTPAPLPAPAPIPIPSTPAPKTRPTPMFTPSVQRTQQLAADGSPTKKPPPVFGPTPARVPPTAPSLSSTSNSIPFLVNTNIMTPAHTHTLPVVPPPLPTMSSALPSTIIPATPTGQRRTPPVFTPKVLFPPQQESSSGHMVEEAGGGPKAKVSRAPVFGVLEEGEVEEGTPRAGAGSGDVFGGKVELEDPGGESDADAEGEDEEEGDLSMADMFDASAAVLHSDGGIILPTSPRPAETLDDQDLLGATDELAPLPSLSINGVVGPSARTRSRSRSASASGSVAGADVGMVSKAGSRAGSVSRSRAGSVAMSRAGSVPLSKAGSTPLSRPASVSASGPATIQTTSQASPTQPTSRPSSQPGSKSTTPRSLSLSLAPLVTDPQYLSSLHSQSQSQLQSGSRKNSFDLYRISQAAAMMADTPAEETPSVFDDMDSRAAIDENGNDEEMDMSTSPLSSLPDDMSMGFLTVGDDAGDSTMQEEEEGDTTARDPGADRTMQDAHTTAVARSNPFANADRSMEMRDPTDIVTISSPPPAPTSPVSSLPGDVRMRNEPLEYVDVVGLSSPAKPLSVDGRSRSSSLTSLSDMEEEGEIGEDAKGDGKVARKSMIPVPKRPVTPGGMRPAAAGSKTPFGVNGKSGVTPGPGKNGVTPGPSKNGVTPGPSRNGGTLGTSKPGIARNGITPAPEKGGATPGPGAPKGGVASAVKAVAGRTAPTPGRPSAPATSSSALFPSASLAESSTAALDKGKLSTGKATLATRTRAGAVKARTLAAPTASTAAKTRAKIVTAPPPPRSRITSFMKPNAPPATRMPPPPVPPSTSGPTSPRKGMSRDDSDIRGPRRSMISSDTQASLSSLSNALEKLARPSFGGARVGGLPPRPGTSMGFTARPSSSLGFTETGMRPSLLSGTKRIDTNAGENALRSSAGPGASGSGNKPMVKATSALPALPGKKGKAREKDGDISRSDDDADYGAGKGKAKEKEKEKEDPNAPLRSCVIFVDVRTAEGEDAGSLFIDMLRGLGAKIVTRPTPSTTHIVFKSGHQSTLTKHKLYDDPKPFLVGIGWVVECVEKREHVSEERFKVKTDEVSALDLKKRRKAQLPHQMQFMARDPNPAGSKFGTTSVEAAAVARSLEAHATEVAQDAELAAERAKKRTQQKLFPRVRDRSPT